MRCLSLARAVCQSGLYLGDEACAPVFLVGPDASRTVPALQASGMTVIEAERDSLKMAAALRALWPDGADWLVFDDYALSIADEHRMRDVTRHIAVIDDAPARTHDCDLLIDSKSGRLPSEYKNLVPSGTDFLCGSRYALLNPSFAACRAEMAKKNNIEASTGDDSLRVFVSFGMTDVGGLTFETVKALSGAGYVIDAVIGAAAPTAARLTAFSEGRSDVFVHLDTPRVANLMKIADLAVGAAGGTSHERCCLGLPTVAVPVADNQSDIAAELVRERVAVVIGTPNSLPGGEQIRAAVDNLASDVGTRAEMAVRAAKLCDGKGSSRVARVLCTAGVSLRKAGMGDAEDIWTWRNQDDALKYFTSVVRTPWDTHLEWFRKAMRNPEIELFISEFEGNAVGHLRLDHPTLTECEFTKNEPTRGLITVGICMAPDAKGLGLGRASLQTVIRYAAERGYAGLSAQVHVDNLASQRLFEGLGFQSARKSSGISFLQFTLTFNDTSQ